jgi:hypothetical protein
MSPARNAPGNHDARDPDPCTDPDEYEVTRHLEKSVAEEKDAGTPAIDVGGESEIPVHRQRGERDIRAIDVRNEVTDHDQWDQSPRDSDDGFPVWTRRA